MLTTQTSGKIIVSLTQSWRYLLFLSLLPYLSALLFLSINIQGKLSVLVASILFLFTQYHLFRLWLDSHFFQALYRCQDNEIFDNSLRTLFPTRPNKLSMEARWLGTKRLFSFALIGISIQWLWYLIYFIF